MFNNLRVATKRCQAALVRTCSCMCHEHILREKNLLEMVRSYCRAKVVSHIHRFLSHMTVTLKCLISFTGSYTSANYLYLLVLRVLNRYALFLSPQSFSRLTSAMLIYVANNGSGTSRLRLRGIQQTRDPHHSGKYGS